MFFSKDVVFFHAPSVYDFRQHKAASGPIADVIPSSTVFDMYPMGLTSIAEYMEDRGCRVQLVNLASRMLNDSNFDVEKTIARSRAILFGIDLHWLPHAQGSIEIAKIIKKYHPHKKVLIGGLTASYFHRQLMDYPCVDYVLRGDSVEEPCYRLLQAVTQNLSLEEVPNLTYKDAEGRIKENDLSHIPDNLDYVNIPGYRYVLKSAFKYGSLRNLMPFADWLNYPITPLLTSRGCSYNCAVCGGGKSAYRKICRRQRPAFRSPERLIEDVKLISSFSRAPIFVVHDLRQGGEKYASQFLERLSRENVDNEFILELFKPAREDFFTRVNEAVSRYSLQISMESPLERIRKRYGKFGSSSNEEIFNTLHAAFKKGCQKVDLFFIIGLPGQSYADALECISYTRELHLQLKKELGRPVNVVPFAAPYAPFLDPGSIVDGDTAGFGYTKFWNNLEDYRRALMAPSWKYMLNYETAWMSRDELVEATYDVALGLNDLKFEMGLLDLESSRGVRTKLEKSKKMITAIDAAVESQLGHIPKEPIPPQKAKLILEKVKEVQEIEERESVLCGNEEMRWPIDKRFRNFFCLLRLFLKLGRESLS